ncbi:MAG: lamin tail domain-containing protein [Alphaproteobacteria bacterium]
MRISLYLLPLFALFITSFEGTAADRRADPGRLVVMTFNGEFLWDGRPPEEGQVNFAWKHAPDEADERMQAIAGIIAAHDPDIVNLVEVEGLAALEHLNATFLAGRGYAAYLVKGKDSFTGQDVGLLTRIDPEGGAIARDDRSGASGSTFKSVSKNYFAKLDVGGRKIAILGIHYLSRPGDASRLHQRQAQADATLTQARELAAAGYDIIILGDFNDYTGEQASLDINDHMPITNVLARLQGMDPASADDDLVNALRFVPKARRYTAYWDRDEDSRIDEPEEFSAIDHILISGALAQLIAWAEIDHGHDPRTLTDHFPVIVRFDLPGASPADGVAALRIAWLLPNPDGDERQNEAASIVNTGSSAVSLAGWTLRDAAGRTWSLNALGTLAGGQSMEIMRAGQPMALNNGGDRVDLVDEGGTVRDSVSYGPTGEGDRVEFR